MELEFDKEIDAILRKARDGTGAGAAAARAAHVDADAIAAFAENALPPKTKLLYMEHLADCERCRKQLSHAVLMNSEPVSTIALSTPVAETTVPWYQRLFKTPTLALAMGALVMVFSGFLGYVVLQKQGMSSNTTVSQVAEPERRYSGPYADDSLNAASSNVGSAQTNSAAAANVAANKASNVAAAPAGIPSATPGAQERDDYASGGARTTSETVSPADTSKEEAKPMADAAPPPAPFVLDGVTSRGRDEKKADAEKLKDATSESTLAKRKQIEDPRSRDLPSAAAKTGPSRSGPLQNQSNQINSNIFDMSVTRIVGGKTFDNRQRVWYDSAYSGQATTNVGRGTNEFKKLDGGLKNIANTLGGTVVVVWKGKAYRIQ